MAGVIDKLTCDADPVEFEKLCTVPLYPNAWNRWRLLMVEEGQSQARAEQQIKAALLQFTLKYGGMIRGPVTFGFGAPPWKGKPNQLLSRSNTPCPFPVMLQANKGFREVYVRFIWRGPDQELPWLALKGWGPLATVCPVGADVVLDAVYEPDQEDVPPPGSSSLPPALSSAGEILEGAVSFVRGSNQTMTLLVGVGVGAAAILGAAYLMKGRR